MRAATQRAVGMATVLRHLPGQRRVHELPVERLADVRDERVRATVRYAAAQVPYYRELFRERGIDPRSLTHADALAQLPLLDRRRVQSDPERFRATSRAGRTAVAFTTSGSTGTPVTVYRDRAALFANIAFSERERELEVRYGGRRFSYPVVQIMNPGGNEQRVQQFYARTSFRPFRPRLHAPRVVVYGGDTMSPSGRRLVEDEFGIPVLSRYGAAEAFKIGFFCEERRAFHLHEDLCHVRIVDAHGDPVPDGELGEVVVSDLVNRGGVVLNYRLGDLARIVGRGCACGRTTRLLADLEGRVNSVLVLDDGTIVHSVMVDKTIRRDGVLRFQLEQLTDRRFVLRLLLRDPSVFAETAERIVEDLVALLRGAEVDVEHRPELESAPGPKFRTVLPLRAAEVPVL